MRGGRDEADKIAGLRHARTAIASGTDDATALAAAGFVMGVFSKDYKAAAGVIERALSINPSSAAAHYSGRSNPRFQRQLRCRDRARQSCAAAEPIRSVGFCSPYSARTCGGLGGPL